MTISSQNNLTSTTIDVPYLDTAPCIGMAALSWPILKQTLDNWIKLIHHHLGGRSIQFKIPAEFRRKAQYLNRAFSCLPILTPCSSRCRKIISDAQQFAKLRHFLIHGAARRYDPSGHAIIFVKVDINRDADICVESQRWIGIVEILEEVAKWQELIQESCYLGMLVSKIVSGEDKKNYNTCANSV